MHCFQLCMTTNLGHAVLCHISIWLPQKCIACTLSGCLLPESRLTIVMVFWPNAGLWSWCFRSTYSVHNWCRTFWQAWWQTDKDWCCICFFWEGAKGPGSPVWLIFGFTHSAFFFSIDIEDFFPDLLYRVSFSQNTVMLSAASVQDFYRTLSGMTMLVTKMTTIVWGLTRSGLLLLQVMLYNAKLWEKTLQSFDLSQLSTTYKVCPVSNWQEVWLLLELSLCFVLMVLSHKGDGDIRLPFLYPWC